MPPPPSAATAMTGVVPRAGLQLAPVEPCWRAALDALPDTLAVLDATGEIVMVNRAWRAFAAANAGTEAALRGNYLEVCERAAGEDPVAADVAGALQELLGGVREQFSRTYPCHAPGIERWFTVSLSALQQGASRHVVVVHQDVSHVHEAERRAREQAEQLEAVGAATAVAGPDGRVREWSDAAEELYGWSAAEAIGRPLPELTVAPVDRKRAAEVAASLEQAGQWEGQLIGCHRDGRTFPVALRHRLLRGSDGRASGSVAISTDLTAAHTAERELRGARGFRDAVLATMPDGLCVLDADGIITYVNEAAERLLDWGREQLLGCSMHDVVQPTTAGGEPRDAASSAIAAALRSGEPVRVDDDVFRRVDGTLLPVSYSAAPFTSERGEPGAVVVFNDITERKARELRVRRELEELAWVERIREALEEDRFELHAQPIVDLATGRTVQHELLVRMVAPDGELVPPGRFLPVAEAHGLIRAIDRHVLPMAFDLAQAGHHVQVNLSADSIGDPTLFRFVRDELRLRAVDPRLVVFELTETALIENEAAAEAFVREVVALGCGVALDDFGTGYGSFHYLKHLPVGVLKIDREFVRDLDGDQGAASRHVITAIVSLARAMGKTTVAEGVETQEALDAVRELGVDHGQGFLFARPAPARTVLPVARRMSA